MFITDHVHFLGNLSTAIDEDHTHSGLVWKYGLLRYTFHRPFYKMQPCCFSRFNSTALDGPLFFQVILMLWHVTMPGKALADTWLNVLASVCTFCPAAPTPMRPDQKWVLGFEVSSQQITHFQHNRSSWLLLSEETNYFWHPLVPSAFWFVLFVILGFLKPALMLSSLRWLPWCTLSSYNHISIFDWFALQLFEGISVLKNQAAWWQ